MSRMNLSLRVPLLILILILLISVVLLRSSCCKLFCPKNAYLVADTTTYLKNISLNVLFKENVALIQKEKIIEDIKDSVRKFYLLYNNAYGTQFNPQFEPTAWCPCDSSLYNLNFTCIDGLGKSAPSPPPGGALRGNGDILDVIAISNNYQITEPVKPEIIDTPIIQDGYKRPRIIKNAVQVNAIPINPATILAILDSGIDTSLFTAPIQNLIWHAPAGTPTLYNFIPYQRVDDLSDSGNNKHGSAVTSLAIKAMGNPGAYPRLMILKALDKNDHGSTFSVSCALSYAIQNHATIVNASLGYLGSADSILKHYIDLCANHKPNPVQLFVAAGNTQEQHRDSAICSVNINNNLLTPGSLFYPAGFSKEFDNITSVTQIREPGASCYYQYFSNDYVSLGVLNSFCCYFKVDFRTTDNYYEGSSFATPVASGLKMAIIIKTNNNILLTGTMWNSLVKKDPLKLITKDGKYIPYKQN
jgi:Subtilase family